MAVVHQRAWHTITGDTTVSLSGQDLISLHPDSGSSPRVVAITGGTDGMEICIQNLSGNPISLVHRSGSAPTDNSRIIMTGLGGTFVLPDTQEVWGVLVDPNDAIVADADRGWYLDSGGQEALARAKTTATTSAPTTSSGTPAAVPEMSLTVTTVGGDVIVSFDMGVDLHAADAGTIQLYVDGSAVASTLRDLSFDVVAGTTKGSPAIGTLVTALAAGSHTFEVRWAASAGNMRGIGLERNLRVIEIA